MKQGQKLIDPVGNQVFLFPMDVMYITQGEYGSISHDLAMDFVGFGESGQIPHYPYYAPVDCKLVAKNYNNGQAYMIWESINDVRVATTEVTKVCWVVMHDDNPLYNVGDVISQGDLMGRTGSSGFATGDHLHLNVAKGSYTGWSPTTHGGGFYELNNSVHIYDYMFVNDTNMINPLSYNWRIYEGGITPPTPTESKKKKGFKWVLYARKLRNKRQGF